jgi:hypothetical protein
MIAIWNRKNLSSVPGDSPHPDIPDSDVFPTVKMIEQARPEGIGHPKSG